MAIPNATNPVAGSQANVDALLDWEDEDNVPSDAGELQQQLNQWADAAWDDPNDAAAQLGLAMVILATAGDHGVTYLGYDLFEELDLQSVTGMAFSADLAPANFMGDALAIAHLTGVPRIRGGTSPVRPMSEDETPSVGELQDWREAVRTDMLPAIANAQERMAAIGDQAAPSLLLLSYTDDDDGETYNVYAADCQCIAAGLQLIRSGLLMVSAVDPDYGSYVWDLDMNQRDTNQDGILTLAEYAPPAPFGDIDGTAWSQAGTCLQDGVSRLIDALDKRQSADPDECVMRALAEATDTPSEIRDYMSDGLAVLSGQVNVTVEYANADWENGQWIDEGTMQVPFNLIELWHNPPASFRGLAPQLYIGLSYGYYELEAEEPSPALTQDGVFEFQLSRVNSDLEQVYYESWQWGFEELPIVISGAPHHLHIPADSRLGRPEADLDFNWDWSQFTGTVTALTVTPVTGQVVAGEWNHRTTTDAKWDDIPDKTLSGVFPDPDAVRDLVDEDYDRTVLTYGSLEITDEPWGVWW